MPFEQDKIALACMLDSKWYDANSKVITAHLFEINSPLKVVCECIAKSYKGNARPPTFYEVMHEFSSNQVYDAIATGQIVQDIFDIAETDLGKWKLETIYTYTKQKALNSTANYIADRLRNNDDPDSIIKDLQLNVNLLKQAASAEHTGWNLERVDNLDYIYQPEYLVGDLLAAGWLAIFYGSAKCLKTMLLMDMLVSVADSLNDKWLLPDDTSLKPMKVETVKSLYIDYDNGMQVLKGRLAALARGHGKPASITDNIQLISFPTNPKFSALDASSIQYTIDLIKEQKFRIVMIDHLLNASGVDNENDSKMAIAMSNLRRIVDETGVLLIANAHTSKTGTSIRGHSSSTDAADITFYVNRQAGTDEIVVKCTNSRHYWPAPFRLLFDYTAVPNDKRILQEARMVLIPFKEIEEGDGQHRGETVTEKKLPQAVSWLRENAALAINKPQKVVQQQVIDATKVSLSYAKKAVNENINRGVLAKGERIGRDVMIVAGNKFPYPEVLVKESIRANRNAQQLSKIRTGINGRG